jgi:hypothetical protein
VECAIPGEHLEEHGPKSEDIGARIRGLAANCDDGRQQIRTATRHCFDLASDTAFRKSINYFDLPRSRITSGD